MRLEDRNATHETSIPRLFSVEHLFLEMLISTLKKHLLDEIGLGNTAFHIPFFVVHNEHIRDSWGFLKRTGTWNSFFGTPITIS